MHPASATHRSGSQVRRPVDVDDTTGHELGRFQREKSDGFTQFFGLGDTTDAALVSDLLALGRSQHRGRHLGLDKTGSNGIDKYALGGPAPVPATVPWH